MPPVDGSWPHAEFVNHLMQALCFKLGFKGFERSVLCYMLPLHRVLPRPRHTHTSPSQAALPYSCPSFTGTFPVLPTISEAVSSDLD